MREPVDISIPTAPVFRPSDSDLSRLTDMINNAGTVAILAAMGAETRAKR